MRRWVALTAMLCLIGSVRAEDPSAGTWVIESLIRDGKPDKSFVGGTRFHDGTKYMVTQAPTSSVPPVQGELKVDTTKTPATIDMKPSSGRYKDKTLLGIMKIEEGKLIIAFAEPGKERPTSFESKEGSGIVVAVHKKAK